MISLPNPEKPDAQDAPERPIVTQGGIEGHLKKALKWPSHDSEPAQTDLFADRNPGPNSRTCPNCGAKSFARRAGWTDDHHAYLLWYCCQHRQEFTSWPS